MPWLLFLVLIAGLLIYALSSNAKVADIGRLMFFAALLALMIAIGPAAAAKLRQLF